MEEQLDLPFNTIEHGNIVCYIFSELKLSLPQTQDIAIGHSLVSKPIFAGVSDPYWVIRCFPRGIREEDNGEYVSLFVFFYSNGRGRSIRGRGEAAGGGGGENNSTGSTFVFQAFVVDADAEPSRPPANKPKVFGLTLGCTNDQISGWRHFVKRRDLESLCAANGVVTIVCGVLLLPDKDAITIPASNMTRHLERMLDCADGSDVSFLVGGETFRAHRAVLVTRSPVFKAELFGSMEEANMPCITLHDIEPAVFKILLRYMYTDGLPPATVDGDDLDESTELFRHILAAADRYGLDRLKLGCAQRLFEGLSVDTVAATLGCAEMYICPELKKRCLDFFMAENFKKVVVTEGYLQLMQRFPSVIDEIKERIET